MMTELQQRRRVANLGVLSVSALVIAASWWVVVRDYRRPRALVAVTPSPTADVRPVAAELAVSARPSGLRPVQAPRRRVVVVRRSRAS